MENHINDNAAAEVSNQVISLIIKNWEERNDKVTEYFNIYEEDVYYKEVSPGRNRAIYLFGHLVSTNDGLISILGFGNRLYPELASIFLTSPDKTVEEIPTLAQLKQHWLAVNELLSKKFAEMTPAEWLNRHERVSEEDFAKDPSRNKLNVLLSRLLHQNYHFGQLAFLHSKN